jgi:hypothetical protein
MLDCVGSLGVKRLKPQHRHHIPGVIDFCAKILERQPPFHFQFGLDDATLYCLELTEKAFRSQGLILSQPVRIGDWERLAEFPLTALMMPYGSRMVTGRPITLEQPVILPGNDREGLWASQLLETVFGPEPEGEQDRHAAERAEPERGSHADHRHGGRVAPFLHRTPRPMALRSHSTHWAPQTRRGTHFGRAPSLPEWLSYGQRKGS